MRSTRSLELASRLASTFSSFILSVARPARSCPVSGQFRSLFCPFLCLLLKMSPPFKVSGSRHARATRDASHSSGPLLRLRQRRHAMMVCTHGLPVSACGLRNACKSAASSLLQLLH